VLHDAGPHDGPKEHTGKPQIANPAGLGGLQLRRGVPPAAMSYAAHPNY